MRSNVNTCLDVLPSRSLPAEQRTIPLSEIAARTKLGGDGVEFLLMKTLSLKLIEGVIDQVDATVQVAGRAHLLLSMWPRFCCGALPSLWLVPASAMIEHACQLCIVWLLPSIIPGTRACEVVAQSLGLRCCAQVSWVQPRVLTLEQAGGLKARLGGWITKVNKASSTLEEQRLGALE